MQGLSHETLCIILAGGHARRMGGGDKPLLSIQGQTLLERIATRMAPQCESVVLNANGDLSRFETAGIVVISDSIPGHPGPLAGILAAMEWATMHRPSIGWIASVPGDTPFIPKDLVSRLHEAREAQGCPCACASSDRYRHHAVGLWPVTMQNELRHAILVEGLRRVRDWAERHAAAEAVWPAIPFDPFFNINTPDDLVRAEALVEQSDPRL